MTYEAYTGLSRLQIVKKVEAAMSEKRFKHVLGVEETAIALAKAYGEDVTKASLAALLHDYAKERPDSDFLTAIDTYQLDSDLKRWDNNIWHGLVGVNMIAEAFSVTDSSILQAIARHTVGASNMTLLDKIVYVADYIEPGRHFPGVEEARRLASENLDKAVAFETANTLAYLASKGFPIYPQTLETYNAYISYLK